MKGRVIVMPNWCSGKLKIRGTRSDLIKFLENAIGPIDFVFEKRKCEIDIDKDFDDMLEVVVKTTGHLESTRRGFIEPSEGYVYFDNDSKSTLCLDYQQAWGFNANEFVTLSKKYNVDFKILGFESGMEFNHDLEVVDGVVVKSVEIKFDDYNWECVDPTLGG